MSCTTSSAPTLAVEALRRIRDGPYKLATEGGQRRLGRLPDAGTGRAAPGSSPIRARAR
jgi:hypothetical protein